MMIFTLYALFGEDIRVSAFTISEDESFYIITIIVLFFFASEIILASIAKKDYWLGFYFWLDLVSTLSLILDIGWVWNAMIGYGNTNSGSKTAQSAGNASRAGTRAGRVIRIIRVIRLIRIVKLYKMAKVVSKKKEDGKLVRGVVNFRGSQIKKIPTQITPEGVFNLSEESVAASMSMSFGSNIEEFSAQNDSKLDNLLADSSFENPAANDSVAENREESKVGKELSELTTRRVIILVLATILGVQMFYNSLYVDDNNSYTYGLDVMNTLVSNNTNFKKS